MPETVIRLRSLVKEYGGKRAVNDLSFHVEAGEVYGLLGHNGAGKSTTVEILEGHRKATSGEVSVLGMDPSASATAVDLRNRIGIVLQSSGIESALTVTEAIDTYGAVYRSRRPTSEVVELAGLTAQRDQRIGSLSGGQKRRVDFALGIVNKPEILFLDEPTTGFDPAARREAWDVVRRLQTEGTTVVLTTHYLDEAEALANRVGVIAHGQMVAEGTPEELTSHSGTTVSFDLPPGTSATGLPVPDGARVDGSAVSFVTDAATTDLHRLTSWAVERGIDLIDLSVARPSLEDIFLTLAGERDVQVSEVQPQSPEVQS